MPSGGSRRPPRQGVVASWPRSPVPLPPAGKARCGRGGEARGASGTRRISTAAELPARRAHPTLIGEEPQNDASRTPALVVDREDSIPSSHAAATGWPSRVDDARTGSHSDGSVSSGHRHEGVVREASNWVNASWGARSSRVMRGSVFSSFSTRARSSGRWPRTGLRSTSGQRSRRRSYRWSRWCGSSWRRRRTCRPR